MDENAILMQLNKNIVTINDMLKILNITGLKYIYIYIYMNKFEFKMGALNPNMFFLYIKVHKNGPK